MLVQTRHEFKLIFLSNNKKMSIIGVSGVPIKITLKKLIRNLAHVLNCEFVAFDGPRKTSTKTYYLKLPEKIDPLETINVINCTQFSYQLEAFMPSDSNIKVPSKTKKIPPTLRRALHIPPNISSKELIQRTQEQIMMEMLSKFTCLYELSKTTNHQLLLVLWQILYQRLEEIQATKTNNSCYNLSKNYRHDYPHLNDFELIKDVLMKIQKIKGIEFQEINKNEFCSYNLEDNDIGDSSILGNNTLETISNQYSDRIITKIMTHIQNFDKNIRPDNQQDLIRAEVRQHIHNMAPHIPTIVKTLIRKNLITNTFQQDFEVFRVYGEPFLPGKDVMNPILKKTSYISVKRSDSIFNLITIKIPVTEYKNFLKCNGTIVSGALLVIRPLMAKTHLEQLREIRATKPETNIDVHEYCMNNG